MPTFRTRIHLCLLIAGFVFLAVDSTPLKSKRQIFREQVLPSSGGKIPDGAFTTDRLALNRLNKAGISIPDGVLLDHRHVYNHPHANRYDPEDEDSLVRIVQKSDGRFLAPEGTYQNGKPSTVSSTYIIRKPSRTANIRAPNQQTPLHQILSVGGPGEVRPAHSSHFPSSGWKTFKFAEAGQSEAYPKNRGYPDRIAYQQVKQSVAYVPVTVPLQLPHKKARKSGQHQVPYSSRGETEDVHNLLNWPELLAEYTRLTHEIGDVHHGFYEHALRQSVHLAPEVVAPFGSHYYGARERYARKSKGISFADHAESPRSKGSTTKITLSCVLAPKNAADGRETKCRLRH